MLLVEKANYKLLRKDLTVALKINLIVKESQLVVSLRKLTTKNKSKINSKVQYAPKVAKKLKIKPLCIKIKRPEEPIRAKQYPFLIERRKKLKPIIDNLVKRKTLEPCSPNIIPPSQQ